MLSFDIRDLAHGAIQVDAGLKGSDAVWLEDDVRPAGAIRVVGRLSGAGGDRYYFSGHIEGEVQSACRRCLAPASEGVSEEAHFLYVPADDEEAGDDPDVFTVDPRAGVVDLRPAVRELWVLTAPAYAVCREECRGLCPSCGADLNQGPCPCGERTDPRWDALRTAATNGGEQVKNKKAKSRKNPAAGGKRK